MKRLDYDNIFDGTKDPITVEKTDDNNYKLIGHGVNFILPRHISDTILKLEEEKNLEFNEINPLYADFSVLVDRNITHFETEPLMQGVETASHGMSSIEDYRFTLNLVKVVLTLFNEDSDELSTNDITDFIDDFKESNEHCEIGNENLRRFYEIIEDKVKDADID